MDCRKTLAYLLDIPFASFFAVFVACIGMWMANCGQTLLDIQVEVHKVVEQSSWGNLWPELKTIDLQGQANFSWLCLIYLNATILAMSFASMDWFYQKRVSRMGPKNMCRMPTVMWFVQWTILAFAIFVMFACCAGVLFGSIGTVLAFMSKGVCKSVDHTDLTQMANEILTAAKGWVCNEEKKCHYMRDLCHRLPESITQQDIELSCDAKSVIAPIMAKLVMIGICVATWQIFAAMIQRANLAAHNARNGFPKRWRDEEEKDVEVVRDTTVQATDGGKILV